MRRADVIGIRTLAVAGLFLAGCASSRVAVHEVWFDKPPQRIAVLPLEGDDDSFSNDLSEALTAELINSGFSVIERSSLARIIKEQSLQYTGALDSRTAIETGRLAGVDFVVLGSFTTRPVTPFFEWLLGDGGERLEIDRVNLRWVNVGTGLVTACASYQNSWRGSVSSIAKNMVHSLDNRLRTLARLPPRSQPLEGGRTRALALNSSR